MSDQERMTGADSGFCAACVGFGENHNDACSEAIDKSKRRHPARASLLAEDEVERLEREGSSK